jgi:hypothetical protein
MCQSPSWPICSFRIRRRSGRTWTSVGGAARMMPKGDVKAILKFPPPWLLKDDPFRSLASALRHAGAYPKDKTLFSEFVWADFFRGCMRAKDVEDDFDSALKAAIVLSRRVAAGDLRVGGTR